MQSAYVRMQAASLVGPWHNLQAFVGLSDASDLAAVYIDSVCYCIKSRISKI